MFNLINEVKKKNPLVLHYTNEVTINDCANITLAIGGSPLMSYSYEEIDDLVKISNSIVINIGTMNSSYIDLFLKAGEAGNKYNKPVILDPVGASASSARKALTEKLIKNIKFDVIKGNSSEIGFISGRDLHSRGVDSLSNGLSADDVKGIARELNTTIASTGEVDIISDGDKIIKIHNGDKKLKYITGTGCMISSLIASFRGACESSLNSAAMGVLSMGLSGELGDASLGTGSFKTSIMDNIYNLNEDVIRKYSKIEII